MERRWIEKDGKEKSAGDNMKERERKRERQRNREGELEKKDRRVKDT